MIRGYKGNHIVNFGSYLKQKRKSLGLKQGQVSTHCNISQGTISRIEHGLFEPDLSLFIKICSSLKIKPEKAIKDLLSKTNK